MIVGDAGDWLQKFRGYDDRFVPRINMIVKGCVESLGDNPLEDQITVNLVERLAKDPVTRRLFHHVEYQFEPTRIDANGVATSLGSIDMAAHIEWDRKTYLAYECKRLNVVNGTTTASLATPYVKEGVLRFVTEQYSEGLPVGCMLGYVLDGDLVNAKPKIHAALKANEQLVAKQGECVELDEIPEIVRFATTHKRKSSGSDIEIRHALVACK